MKIAYIYYLVQKNQLGVEAKIREQGRALAAMQLDCMDIFVANPYYTHTKDFVNFVQFQTQRFPMNYYRYTFQRYRLIERIIPVQQYDYLILRYPLADASGVQFTNKYKVVTEHHTNEELEMQARMTSSQSSLEKLARHILMAQEKRYAPHILGNCQGMISVSDDIGRYELQRANKKNGSMTITVGNGTEVEAVLPTGFKPFDGKSLDMVFLASSLRPWHGLDRVIRSLNQYRGPVHWTIHVLGNVKPEQLDEYNLNLKDVKFHGPKTRGELDEILPNMHLAINTMALFRIALNSVSPLKTSEYTARGLPFILAYEDPNLEMVNPNSRFFLTFPNDDSLLDLPQIIEFAQAMTERREEIIAYMRHYATTMLDWRVKLQQYVDFVQMIDKKGQQ